MSRKISPLSPIPLLLPLLLIAAVPLAAHDSATPPQGTRPAQPAYSAGDGLPPFLLGPGPVVRAYKDSIAWFFEDRDHNTLLDLGFVLGVDYFIHPLAALSNPIPAGTTMVLLSSNGQGLPGAVTAQNAPAAQANLEAFVRAGGALIVDMGDNVTDGGFIAPGAIGTPDYIFPSPCHDATLAPAALGPDGVLGTADDHPLVLGPDGLPATADDLDDSRIDDMGSCSVAHGNLVDGLTLPPDAAVLMTAVFDVPKPVVAEYCLAGGLVVVDTVTKEWTGQQGPLGTGTVPTYFMNNLFSYALERPLWPCTLLEDGFESGDTSAWSNAVP